MHKYSRYRSGKKHKIFADFNKFLVDGKMLMPVISKSERMFQQETSS